MRLCLLKFARFDSLGVVFESSVFFRRILVSEILEGTLALVEALLFLRALGSA